MFAHIKMLQDRFQASAREFMMEQRAAVNATPPICDDCAVRDFDCEQCQLSEDGFPPSYEDVTNPNAPPPTYESLFGRVREAHSKAAGIVDFLKNVLFLILGTLGCSIVLGITIVVPISMIVMAFTYWNDCPKCSYIPVYLLVGGITGLLKQVLHFFTRSGVCKTEPIEDRPRRKQSPWQTIINCFLLGWFFIGSVWVFRAYEPNYDSSSTQGDYCHKSIYMYSFWLLTSVYLILGLVSITLCTISAISILCHRQV